MRSRQQTWEVARWEFGRFVKWKQQVIGTAILLVLGLVVALVGRALNRADNRTTAVAVLGADRLDFSLPAVPGVIWAMESRPEAEVRAAVVEGDLDGALVVTDAGAAELVVPRRAGWTEGVGTALTAARRSAALERLARTPEDLASLAATVEVRTTLVAPGAAKLTLATRIATMVLIGLSGTIIMSGVGTLFAGITGEKQQRVTEQMLAMVSPQVWMDGKILGLLGAAIVGAGFFVGGVGLLALGVPVLLGRAPIRIPDLSLDPGLVLLLLVITALGVVVWFAFLAALAATIDDPNSSARSVALMLPILPSVAAFALIAKADTLAAEVLAIFPLTAMAVMPVRLMVTTVPGWQVTLAIVLLVVTAWLFRRAAGKVFGLGVLMHGKEPSLREMWRWAREA